MVNPPILENLADRFAQALFRMRNRHFLLFDLLVAAPIALTAMWLRTDGQGVMRYLQPLAVFVIAAVTIRVGVFYTTGLYSRYWHYASVGGMWQIVKAVSLAAILGLIVFFGLLYPAGLLPNDFPRSIPFIDALLALLIVGGSRFSVRLADLLRRRPANPDAQTTRVAVFGAGDAGVMIVREMRRNPRLGLLPVVFLDDDANKHGALIHGVPVIGGREQIESVAERYHVERAIIAIPTAPGKTIREVAGLCDRAALPVQTVPGFFELLGGNVKVDKLRSVEIVDLLRREPVVTDTAGVSKLLSGKRVLVTGAGGSIGSELCRQVARCSPSLLILLGHGENSLFHIEHELRRAFPGLLMQVVVGDIRDERRIRSVMHEHRPQMIFHAAAHKHVPMMEANAADAVTNNVLGTRILLDAAINNAVGYFVLISTDKAVNPTSVMGASKRVAELLVHQAAVETRRCFVAVRFGNVLESRGSVVPLFKQQIAEGGPVTVTHPEVRRYFMVIPEAVQLVLQAATLGRGGEVFELDMGEPIKIVDLAKDLIRLSGLEMGRDIDMVFTGLRPGEKLFEELFAPGQKYERTVHEKIFVVPNGVGGKPLARALREQFSTQLDALIVAAQMGNAPLIRELFREIVPEYCPENSRADTVTSATGTATGQFSPAGGRGELQPTAIRAAAAR